MYEEYYITLPGGFVLPLGIAVDTYYPRSLAERELLQYEAEGLLSSYAGNYIRDDMLAGEILKPGESFARGSGIFVLSGDYQCREMIGRIQWEQIGEYNE